MVPNHKSWDSSMFERCKAFVSSVSDSEHLKAFLKSHLPYTLPLLRRLQYHLQGPEAVAISSFDATSSASPGNFAVGFIDPQAGGIQAFISTSLDLPYASRDSCRADDDTESIFTCLRTLFASIKEVCASSVEPKYSILVGCINSTTANFLKNKFIDGFVLNNMNSPGGPYGKYLLRRSRMQDLVDFSLPEDFYYDDIKEPDYDLVLANNNLIGTARNLSGRPSVGIRQRSSGFLRAFAFLGPDGSTRTLHVMPEFRTQGFGRKIAAKTVLLIADAFNDPEDEWAHGDVDLKNIASVRLFKGLEAVHKWDSYWYCVDLNKISA